MLPVGTPTLEAVGEAAGHVAAEAACTEAATVAAAAAATAAPVAPKVLQVGTRVAQQYVRRVFACWYASSG